MLVAEGGPGGALSGGAGRLRSSAAASSLWPGHAERLIVEHFPAATVAADRSLGVQPQRWDQVPPCAEDGPGLWFRGTSEDAVGYVLQRHRVTITVTGGVWPRGNDSDAEYAPLRKAALRQVILAAHLATDAELWSREPSGPSTLAARLLL